MYAKRKDGRPPKSMAEKRTHAITLHVNDAELAVFRRNAERERRSLAEYVRLLVLDDDAEGTP